MTDIRPVKIMETANILMKTYHRILDNCDAKINLDDLEYGTRIVLTSSKGNYLVDVGPGEDFLEITPITINKEDSR